MLIYVIHTFLLSYLTESVLELEIAPVEVEDVFGAGEHVVDLLEFVVGVGRCRCSTLDFVEGF